MVYKKYAEVATSNSSINVNQSSVSPPYPLTLTDAYHCRHSLVLHIRNFCGYNFSQIFKEKCSKKFLNCDHTPHYLRSRMTTTREFSVHFIMETMELGGGELKTVIAHELNSFSKIPFLFCSLRWVFPVDTLGLLVKYPQCPLEW